MTGLKVLVAVPGNLPEPLWYGTGRGRWPHLGPGSVVRVPLQHREAGGIALETRAFDPGFAVREVLDTGPRLPPGWLRLVNWMGDYYQAPLSKVVAAALPRSFWAAVAAGAGPTTRGDAGRPGDGDTAGSGPPLGEGTNTSLSMQSKRGPSPSLGRAAADPEPARNTGGPPERELELTVEQRGAVGAVIAGLPAAGPARFESFLLQGITGSGKTLVYLHAVKRCLEVGRTALVLLPEIALTGQLVTRFQDFLGLRVHVAHSGLPAPERRRTWADILAGKVRVLVGVRSAILAPLDSLGLVVVDEEHDGSYKQSDAVPRYNARDLALVRGRLESAPVVLGSATPSLESFSAAREGKHGWLRLGGRHRGGRLPAIHLVDMRQQRELQGDLPLSIPLREGLERCLERGHQAILLLNRRGYSRRRICLDCGATPACERCLSPFVPHRQRGIALCHICDRSIPLRQFHCPDCGGNRFEEVGMAVEGVEEYLGEIWPGIEVARLDRDSTRRIGSAQKILSRFEAGFTRVLLGTQMVAKGHDFPGVRVVGILDGDTGLGLPDFRAHERVFQLITQVSGRAGRLSEDGEVFLQTWRPKSAIIGQALKGDYEGFCTSELDVRRELGLPPATRMLKVEFSGRQEERVMAAIERLARGLEAPAQRAQCGLLGPGPAIRKKARGLYRAQLFLKAPTAGALDWLWGHAPGHLPPGRTVAWSVDRDPQSVL